LAYACAASAILRASGSSDASSCSTIEVVSKIRNALRCLDGCGL
jgi:hypothetical protein